MAISLYEFSPGTSGTATGFSPPLPSGILDNDIAIVIICKATNAAPTAIPSGYVALDTLPEGQTNNFTWWYGKVLAASDSGGTHTFTWASTTCQCARYILRGVDPAQIQDVTDPPAATTGNGVTTVNTPATASVTPGAWALWTASVGTAGTKAWPATVNGNTVTRDLGSASGMLGSARAPYATAGTISAAAVTLGTSTRVTAKTLVIKPLVPVALQRWTGSAWTPVASVQRWDGAAWVPATTKRWNGTTWV